MQGDERVIEFLNEQLTAELTAINQYFLHAKMQENWGFTVLAKHTRAESMDEMRHTEQLVDRIVYFDAIPNLNKIGRVKVGETVRGQFELALAYHSEGSRHSHCGTDRDRIWRQLRRASFDQPLGNADEPNYSASRERCDRQAAGLRRHRQRLGGERI